MWIWLTSIGDSVCLRSPAPTSMLPPLQMTMDNTAPYPLLNPTLLSRIRRSVAVGHVERSKCPPTYVAPWVPATQGNQTPTHKHNTPNQNTTTTNRPHPQTHNPHPTTHTTTTETASSPCAPEHQTPNLNHNTPPNPNPHPTTHTTTTTTDRYSIVAVRPRGLATLVTVLHINSYSTLWGLTHLGVKMGNLPEGWRTACHGA